MCTMNLVVWVQVLWIFVFTASIMTMTSLITIGHVVISVRLGISPLFKYNITQNAYICLFSCVGFRVLSQIACSWLYEVAMITVYCFFSSPECDIMCNLKLLLSAIFWSHQMHLRGSPHDQLSRQIRTLKGERKIRPRPSPRPPCQPPRRQPNALVCPPPPQWHPSPPQQPQPAPLSAQPPTPTLHVGHHVGHLVFLHVGHNVGHLVFFHVGHHHLNHVRHPHDQFCRQIWAIKTKKWKVGQMR